MRDASSVYLILRQKKTPAVSLITAGEVNRRNRKTLSCVPVATQPLARLYDVTPQLQVAKFLTFFCKFVVNQ